MTDYITVIVPVYNIAPYIERCVRSLQNQTYPYLEILLIDDGSTDGTGMLCDTLAEKDSRIRVVHKPNSGVSDSRNIGLSLATGNWISFIDGDDWLENTCYAEMLERYSTYDLILWNRRDNYEDGTQSDYSRYDTFCTHSVTDKFKFVQQNFYCENENGTPYLPPTGVVWNRLIRRKILTDYGLCFQTTLTNHEDFLFTLIENELVQSVALCDTPYYHRFIRKNSAVRKFNPHIEANNDIACQELQAYLQKFHPNEPTFEKAAKQYRIGWLFQILELDIFHPDSPLSFWEKRRELKRLTQKKPYSTSFDEFMPHASKAKRLFCFFLRHKLYLLVTLLLTFKYKRRN